MAARRFWVTGRPATFATAGEKPWKATLAAGLPRPDLDGRERGVALRFVLPTLAPNGQPLDVDNLCEPMFAVLIGQLGWFGGAKPGLQWWSATKEVGSPTGCHGVIHDEGMPALPAEPPDWDEVYRGPLPLSARSPELAAWAGDLRRRRGDTHGPESCALHLRFADERCNIGEIASGGVVKPVVDCLYPWLGGVAGAPEDPRVKRLMVEKGIGSLPAGSVAIRMWMLGRVPLAAEVRRPAAPAKEASRPGGPLRESPAVPPTEAISNPCRFGSAKWIVCQAALEGWPVARLMDGLEGIARGASARLGQYISDVRSENRLDIQIEGDRIVCRGRR